MQPDRTAAYPLSRLRELKYAEAAFLVASGCAEAWRRGFVDEAQTDV